MQDAQVDILPADSLQDAPILQDRLPEAVLHSLAPGRLPGTRPARPEDSWIQLDGAFAGQMALRDRLLAERRDAVHALTDPARPAAEELLGTVLALLADRPGYAVRTDSVQRPDGVQVPIDPSTPLVTLGRLVQEDLCLMQEGPDGHVLTGAVLCFPASWSLDEKLGRALPGIHWPVRSYDADLTRRVQRLFDAIRVGAPMERANLLPYDDATLFTPRREDDRRSKPAENATFIRSERQCLVRLPETRAVLFTIHTYIVRRAGLPADQQAAVDAILASGTPD